MRVRCKCGYEWTPATESLPKTCPACATYVKGAIQELAKESA